MPTNIKRFLVHKEAGQAHKCIAQDQVASFDQPVVILGDPGLGKSTLTRALGERPGMKYVRAGTLNRTANPSALIVAGERIIVDGVDEIGVGCARRRCRFRPEKVVRDGQAVFHSLLP